ncbi:GNAT family N-acetyltransferase [Mesorhizobium sp. BR1-1-16]|uniref:GNAT family N-acetyltransferase n=1 Tax=Mesorhizobium sp. BR1-1-16 TaxID=2876653 RepID=UPI001CC90347|nr:GNAT family N-acetyltransferase [Mesorhizobium sp. BR1-1-16]MBZ9935839.1 GNAT family N-acetyltransferase [Mesorhizobium sp. BR1-1-16]
MTDAPRLWTPLQRLTQKRIAANADMIAAAPDLATDIRYLYLFLQSPADCARAADILRRFGRAMIHLPTLGAGRLVEQLRSDGFIVKTGLSVLSGAANDVLAQSEALAGRSSLPGGMTVISVAEGLSDEEAARIQAMQLMGGLVPMPGEAISDPRAGGIVLRDSSAEIIGFASQLPLASGGQRQGLYLVNGVVIDPAWRGRGLGSWLTAMAMTRSRNSDAATFLSSVDVDNGPSVAMQRGCGLRLVGSQAFLFARVSEEDEAALIATEAIA